MGRGPHVRLDGKQTEILDYEEVLAILSAEARAGSVSAATALERALRAKAKAEKEDFDAELADVLAEE